MSTLSLEEPFYELDQQIAIDLAGARAVFTTRRGGSSSPPYDTLNLGISTDDSPQSVAANRSWVERRFEVALAWNRQVHGACVRTVSAANSEADGAVHEADAVATATRGIGALVLSADCLPVAIAGAGAVAAVHAGWKGLHGGVIAHGVEAVRDLARADGGTRTELVAAIGPAAGPCCYEVSEDLHRRFADAPGYARRGRNLDLKSIARAQLRQAGVNVVHDVGICTICDDRGLLFSHRRDHGVTGRQGVVVWLR